MSDRYPDRGRAEQDRTGPQQRYLPHTSPNFHHSLYSTQLYTVEQCWDRPAGAGGGGEAGWREEPDDITWCRRRVATLAPPARPLAGRPHCVNTGPRCLAV